MTIAHLQSISEMPESMAGQLTLLIILPVIMTACGIFSIVSSVLMMVILVISDLKRRKMQQEEEDIKYSNVPVTEKDVILGENIAGSESSLQKCRNV